MVAVAVVNVTFRAPPRIALLILGDGRDALRTATLESLKAAVDPFHFATVVSVDDRRHDLGFCGAIQHGWERLRIDIGPAHAFDYVLHVEEDWRFDRPIDLAAMAHLLDHSVSIAQVALRRNAVAPSEIKAGGLVELWPDEYLDKCLDGDERALEYPWLDHGLYFTTNPSLYRASLLDRAWPNGPGCEEAFSRALIADGFRFAMWGSRRGGPWITHTGKTRTGTGY